MIDAKFLDLACAHINDHPLEWSCRTLAAATFKSWGSWQHQFGNAASLAQQLIEYSNQGDNQVAYHDLILMRHDLAACRYQLRPTPLSPYAQSVLATKYSLASAYSYHQAIVIEQQRLKFDNKQPRCIPNGVSRNVVQALSARPYFSVSTLITELGISRGAFYHHFDNLEHARQATIAHY